MKKKVLAIALAVALLAVAVTGSLAWFTDSDKATNTFTVGSIEIDLVEDFTAPKAMLPVVNVDNPEADPNFINKDAWVENEGKNPAYVQLLVAVPKVLDNTGAFHIVDGDMNAWNKVGFVGETNIGTTVYNVYRYTYNYRLEVGTNTAFAITGAYLDAKLDYNNETDRFVMDGVELTEYVPGTQIDVYVVAQAVQAEGFADAESALNAAFGNTIPEFQS